MKDRVATVSLVKINKGLWFWYIWKIHKTFLQNLNDCLVEDIGSCCLITLDTGIDVGPTFIDFGFFFRPYGLIKGPMFIIFWIFFPALRMFSSFSLKNHSSPYIYSFWQSFLALHLFFLQNFLCSTFILFLRLFRSLEQVPFFINAYKLFSWYAQNW